MGQALSCGKPNIENDFFSAAQSGELELAKSILRQEPEIIRRTISFDNLSSFHIAAANGHDEMLSMLLDRWDHPDALNRRRQTPLMLAAKRGKIACVEKLLLAGANILLFDSSNRRSCLHYAAYYGHSDCLQAVLNAAHSNLISESWGFSRFVNVRDAKGATPLHLAAKTGRPTCVKMLLDEGAIVGVSSGGYGFVGSSPLHLAARSGNLESVRELLAYGADRLKLDSKGRTPYTIALKRKHSRVAALLNPSSAEPLVWPSPLKLISELSPDVKLTLQEALVVANRKREEEIFKSTGFVPPSSPTHSEHSEGRSTVGLCYICFDEACTIELKECRHQMCSRCILILCCHKPSSSAFPPAEAKPPLCPFCRGDIARLTAITPVLVDESPKERKSRQLTRESDESNSFKSSSSGKMTGHDSGNK